MVTGPPAVSNRRHWCWKSNRACAHVFGHWQRTFFVHLGLVNSSTEGEHRPAGCDAALSVLKTVCLLAGTSMSTCQSAGHSLLATAKQAPADSVFCCTCTVLFARLEVVSLEANLEDKYVECIKSPSLVSGTAQKIWVQKVCMFDCLGHSSIACNGSDYFATPFAACRAIWIACAHVHVLMCIMCSPILYSLMGTCTLG